MIEENGWGYVRITNEFEVILDKSSILVEFQNAKKDPVLNLHYFPSCKIVPNQFLNMSLLNQTEYTNHTLCY